MEKLTAFVFSKSSVSRYVCKNVRNKKKCIKKHEHMIFFILIGKFKDMLCQQNISFRLH